MIGTDKPAPQATGETNHRAYRAALLVLLLAQLVIGLNGIDQEIQFGHHGYHVAEHGIGARNLDRWGTFTHTTYHGPGEPPEDSLNFHHLTMLQVPVCFTQTLFGDQRPWPVRSVGLLFGLAAVLGVWAFASRARGPAVGIVATAAFVFNPLHVAFGNLPDIQIVSIAWLAWTGVGLLAMFERPTWRRVALVWLCVANGAFGDWPFYPVIFFVALFVAFKVRPYTPLNETLGKSGVVRIRVALLGICLLVLLVFGQHVLRAHLHDRLQDLFGAYGGRSQGQTLCDFAGSALDMLVFSHTAMLLILTAIWLVWWPVARRTDLATQFVAAIFIGQTIWMFTFQTEFWIHEYRSYWFVLPFALVTGDIALGGARALTRVFKRPALTGLLTLLLGAVALFFMVSEAVPMLELSRAHAGSTRVDPYNPRRAQMVAARAIHALTPPDTPVVLGPVLEDRLELHWLIDRPSWQILSPNGLAPLREQGDRVVLFHSANTLRTRRWGRQVREGRVLLVDDYAIVEFGQDITPSVESARHMTPPTYGPVARWLKAADGSPVLVPGDPQAAAAFAREIDADESVVERALAGETPVLDALPDDLVLDIVEPSQLAFTDRVGGWGGIESTAQCWRRQAVSQIAAATDRDQPNRLAWSRPDCQDVRLQDGHLRFQGTADPGPLYGIHQGRATTLRCTDSMLPVGLFARAGSMIDRIGLLCAEVRPRSSQDSRPSPSEGRGRPAPPSTWVRAPVVREGAVGGEGGVAYDLICPDDTLLFGLVGRSGALVDSLGASCVAIDALLTGP